MCVSIMKIYLGKYVPIKIFILLVMVLKQANISKISIKPVYKYK